MFSTPPSSQLSNSAYQPVNSSVPDSGSIYANLRWPVKLGQLLTQLGAIASLDLNLGNSIALISIVMMPQLRGPTAIATGLRWI